jgi:hypothetical protein
MFGGEISWMSKRQVVIALSTTEVEYMEPLMEEKKQYGCNDCVQGSGLSREL